MRDLLAPTGPNPERVFPWETLIESATSIDPGYHSRVVCKERERVWNFASTKNLKVLVKAGG